LVPDIDGKLHHFSNAGLYDGLFVMQDAETKTLWNHITGEALYGLLVGRNLGPVGNLLQMNVKQALVMDPKMHVAISDRIYFAGGRQFGSARSPLAGLANRHGNEPNPNAEMTPLFVKTLGKEDQRRPRMELGLGVWAGAMHRYYPMERIREHGRAFVDQLDGRSSSTLIPKPIRLPRCSSTLRRPRCTVMRFISIAVLCYAKQYYSTGMASVRMRSDPSRSSLAGTVLP
jgi:hypothetical protein